MLPENAIIDHIISKYGSMFTDGRGGINPDGIRYALELEGIKDNQTTAYKIIVYVRTVLDLQKTRSK